jgi:hypothetical protein
MCIMLQQTVVKATGKKVVCIRGGLEISVSDVNVAVGSSLSELLYVEYLYYGLDDRRIVLRFPSEI